MMLHLWSRQIPARVLWDCSAECIAMTDYIMEIMTPAILDNVPATDCRR
jgi:hypothetical protein